MAVSRPEPGPLTKTSTFCSPCSMPLRAQESAVTWAANGVDLREPLKPAEPALSHAMTFPSLSVRLTIVLLKDVLMCAWPTAMFFLTRRRARPLDWRRGGATSDHLPARSCSRTAKSERRKDAESVRSRRLRARPRTPRGDALQPSRECEMGGRRSPSGLGLLPAADGLLRALAGARVRLRPLPVHRQAAAVADAAVGADLLQALDCLRALAPELALDLEVRVDVRPQLRDLLVGQVADLLVAGEAELGADLLRARLADAVDVRERHLEALLTGEVHSCDPGQTRLLRSLALPLLVPRVRADDQHAAVPLDHAAAVTHRLDGW